MMPTTVDLFHWSRTSLGLWRRHLVGASRLFVTHEGYSELIDVRGIQFVVLRQVFGISLVKISV
jgi:hypothetical protein